LHVRVKATENRRINVTSLFLFIFCFSKVRWNPRIIIFGWCENILVGISWSKITN